MAYIKKYNEHNDLDPFNEEDWDDKNVIYDGDIVKWANEINNPELTRLVGDILFNDDLDDRMDLADDLLSFIDTNYPQYYDLVEDDVRDLAIS